MPDSPEQERIEREYAYFRSLDPPPQQQLRELDQFLNELEGESRERFERVLNNYNYWLSQLSEKDRQSVVSEKNWEERLKAIRRIKDHEWVETLPKSYRERYAKAAPAERMRLVEVWRQDQKKRREEWQQALAELQFVRSYWDDFKSAISSLSQRDSNFRKDLDGFAEHMAYQIADPQVKNLLLQGNNLPPEDRGFAYFSKLVSLADRHTLLPGPTDGPRTYDDLPKGVREPLEKAVPKIFAKAVPRRFQINEGRYPDLAVAVVESARFHKVALPEHLLGPTTKTAFAVPEVREAIDKLEAQLKKAEKGKSPEQAAKDLKRLKDAEFKWPDYPRAVLELARAHKIEIPGWTLPGPPELWARFRVKKG